MKNFINSDFVNEDIFPIKIIDKKGKVYNEQVLLEPKPLQITTSEENYLTLENGTIKQNSYIILDFGKELHGRIRILTYTTKGASPIKMRITYGESVSEALSDIGTKGATNDHAIRDQEHIFPSYSDISLNNSGFRFAKIELMGKNNQINIKAIVAVAEYRNIEYLGYFKCDNDTLNEIFDVCAYTCHLNMQQYIWDGIKRDRLVWVGDMHPEMLTVKTVFGGNKIIDQSLRFMKNTTPLPNWMNGMPTYSLWWLHILYDWYFYTGNKELLAEHKDYTLELIKNVCKLVNSDGSDNLPSYFLDWPCNGKPQGKSGSRALLALSLRSCSKLCDLYNATALKTAVDERYNRLISTSVDTYGAKQVSAMLGMSDWKDKVQCGKDILSNGANGWSTFMSYYLLKIAAEYDMDLTLNALIEYYGGMLKMGATTFWEDFDINWTKNASRIDELPSKNKNDIHADFGAFCYKGLRHSLCHGWSSAPTAFLIEDVLGIKVEEAGCKTISIHPNLGNLNFAEGAFPTPYGLIKVTCRKENDKINITYNAPDEIKIIL